MRNQHRELRMRGNWCTNGERTHEREKKGRFGHQLADSATEVVLRLENSLLFRGQLWRSVLACQDLLLPPLFLGQLLSSVTRRFCKLQARIRVKEDPSRQRVDRKRVGREIE